MKITKKICREVHIINDWEYANPTGHKGEHYPFLYYSPAETGRASRSSEWCISLHGKVLSDHWRDYGAKRFMIWNRKEKEAKFQMAVEWMCNKFGFIKENIVKTPMGSWMHKDFVDKRNKEIEVLYKQLQSNS